MQARIDIAQLKVLTLIGASRHERVAPQVVYVDLSFRYDCTLAAASDDLADAVDYARVARNVRELGQNSSFALIEALAAAIFRQVNAIPTVSQVRVRVTKPGVPDRAQGVSVELGE